jgi:hypothetical protein
MNTGQWIMAKKSIYHGHESIRPVTSTDYAGTEVTLQDYNRELPASNLALTNDFYDYLFFLLVFMSLQENARSIHSNL